MKNIKQLHVKGKAIKIGIEFEGSAYIMYYVMCNMTLVFNKINLTFSFRVSLTVTCFYRLRETVHCFASYESFGCSLAILSS